MAWTTEEWKQDDAVFYGYPIPVGVSAPEIIDKSSLPSRWIFDNAFYGYPHTLEIDIPVEWIEPIANRQFSDIKNAIKNSNRKKQNPAIEFEFTKAYLNYTDLNRIENNTKYLSKELRIAATVKLDWTAEKIPLVSDRTRILQNMDDIRSKFLEIYPEIELETVPTKLSTYADFNQLENVQLRIYETISEGGE